MISKDYLLNEIPTIVYGKFFNGNNQDEIDRYVSSLLNRTVYQKIVDMTISCDSNKEYYMSFSTIMSIFSCTIDVGYQGQWDFNRLFKEHFAERFSLDLVKKSIEKMAAYIDPFDTIIEIKIL